MIATLLVVSRCYFTASVWFYWHIRSKTFSISPVFEGVEGSREVKKLLKEKGIRKYCIAFQI